MASDPHPYKSQQIPISEHYDMPSIQSDVSSIIQAIEHVMPAGTEVVHQDDWLHIGKKYAFAGFMINQKIVLYWAKGHVKKEDCPAVMLIMEQIIAYNGKKNLYQILDLSQILSFSLGARKFYENIHKKHSPYWRRSYYVFSGLGNTIFKIYTAINPKISKEVTLTESLTQALQLCSEDGLSEPEPSATAFDPKTADRETLIAQYQQLEQQHKNLLNDRENKADMLLKIIARVSWDENFDNFIPPLSQGDPFYNVFGALSLLKQDLGEIYDKQQQTNQVLEKEVAYRNRQLAAVIENTSDMIMSVDRQWKVQVVNSSFQHHFLKFQGTEIKVGSDLLSLYASEGSLNYWKNRIERAFAEGRFQEMVDIKTNGKKVFYELTYNPIREPGKDEVTEVSVFGRDITQLRVAEEEARENEKNLTRSLQIARSGSWELDFNTNKITIGREGMEVLGYTDQQEMKMTVDEFLKNMLHPDDVPFMREKIAHAAANMDDPDFQDQFPYRLMNSEGQTLHLKLYSRFKSNEKGVIYGITQDISQHKEYEEQLLQQNAALRKLNNELDHFAYSVSHDLRAPLASVLGLIYVARQEDNIDTIKHYLDLKEKSIQKLDTYIQEIIDLSKNVRLEVQREPVNFKDLIEDVYEDHNYDEANQDVLKKVAVKQEQAFYSDYRRLRVILQNLVSNALRYANHRQDEPFVRVSAQVEQGQAYLEVEDNGLGISTEYLPRIFDIFYRASETKAGSGLGLYIVKETLEKLGGTIRVDSQRGKGTKFTVMLPDLC